MVVLAIPERRQISSMEKPGTPSAMSNPSAASRILCCVPRVIVPTFLARVGKTATA